MQLINYFIVLNIIFFGDIKAEIIRGICREKGQQCHFSETCCSKKCIYRLESEYLGGTCMEDKTELIKTGKNDDYVISCLPIGAKCVHRTECCSNKCNEVCRYKMSPSYMLATRTLYPEYCLTVGKRCFFNSDCCSSRCIREQKKPRFVCDSDDGVNLPSFLNSYEITDRELKAGICRSPSQDCYINEDCCYGRCIRYDSKSILNPFCDARRDSA